MGAHERQIVIFSVAHCTALVQRIFNCGNIWNVSLTPDKVLNVFIITPLCRNTVCWTIGIGVGGRDMW